MQIFPKVTYRIIWQAGQRRQRKNDCVFVRILGEGTEAKEKARLPVHLASGPCKSPNKTIAVTVVCSHARPVPPAISCGCDNRTWMWNASSSAKTIQMGIFFVK